MDNLEFFIDNQQFLTSLEIHVVPVFRCLPTILNMQFLIDLEISICNLDMMNSPEFNVKNYTVNSLKVGFGKFGIGFRGIQGWSFRSMRNFLCLFVNVQYMEVKIVLNNNLNQLKEPAWMFHLDPLQSLNVAKFDISYVRVDSLATTSKTPDVLGKTLKWLRIKQMQSLKIGPVVNATYGDWWSFAENNKQLETLIIRQNHDSKISRESIQMLIANLPDLQKFKTYPCVSECSECVVICNCQQRFNRRHYFEGRDLLDLLDSDYEDDHDDDLISSESF